MVGRIFSFFLIFSSLVVIPVIETTAGIYIFSQSISACISPPIAVIFLVGVFWSKATERGAIASLISGSVLGVIRMIMEISYGISEMKEQFMSIPILGVNFLIFAIIEFFVSLIFMIVFSLRSYKKQTPSKETMSELAEPLMDYDSIPGTISARPTQELIVINQNPLTNLTWYTLETRSMSNRGLMWNRIIVSLSVALILTILSLFINYA